MYHAIHRRKGSSECNLIYIYIYIIIGIELLHNLCLSNDEGSHHLSMTKKNNIYRLANELGQILLQRHLCCTVAESCTGGLLSAAITDVPGSSAWFDRGFVTYTNNAKEELLAVPAELIAKEGAVSEAVVDAMAKGAILASGAQVSIAISGIAGPGGGTPQKPVGTVCIAWVIPFQSVRIISYLFKGDRGEVRQQAVEAGLEGLIDFILNEGANSCQINLLK